MIERHVYLRLLPEQRTECGLREVADRTEALTSLPMVRSLRILRAADERAQAAWDLCLVIHFDDLSGYALFRDDPAHRHYVDEFLAARTQVVKAWNLQE